MAVLRRDFMKTAAGALLAAGRMARNTFAAGSGPKPPELIPKRKLGKTGEMLSVIGLGGIVVKGASQAEADRRVAAAMERGVNYFDVSPIYGDAQERLGPALVGKRDKVFLACKTNKRTGKEADAELQESLRLLKTEHLDLYQLHSMTTPQDVETAFGPGGAIETFKEAREKGVVRYIGFSAHSVQAATACMDRFEFDTVLYPVNFALWENGFSPPVIEKAKAKGMGCLGLKAMALGRIQRGAPKPFDKCWYVPISELGPAALALRFALSKGLTAVIPPGDEDLFFMALEAKDLTKPLTDDEVAQLEELYEGATPLFTPAPPEARPRRRG